LGRNRRVADMDDAFNKRKPCSILSALTDTAALLISKCCPGIILENRPARVKLLVRASGQTTNPRRLISPWRLGTRGKGPIQRASGEEGVEHGKWAVKILRRTEVAKGHLGVQTGRRGNGFVS